MDGTRDGVPRGELTPRIARFYRRAGLAQRVRTARRDAASNRHVLYLSPEKTAFVAYAFWLHRTCFALEADRFARDYGITHRAGPYAEPSACAIGA